MNTIRAFIAIEIDKPNRQKILDLILRLKRSDADIKWLDENQIHLTVKFLGNIDKNKIQETRGIIKPVTDNFSVFTIRFSKIGAFPNMRQPRVIWIGFDKGAESLKLLNNKIETGLEKIGFKKEGREYKAHLTLGRVKSLKNIAKLMPLINEINFQAHDEIEIKRLVLFQSTLTSKAAIYAPLAEFPLSTYPIDSLKDQISI